MLTRPDARAGRGRREVRSPVAQHADEAGVPVLQPRSPREPAFLEQLADRGKYRLGFAIARLARATSGQLDLVKQSQAACDALALESGETTNLAVLDGDRIVGLGTVPRVVDAVASRPQLQERLGEEIADAFVEGLSPAGVLVVLDAVHGCVTTRGPRQVGSSTITVASRGALAEPAARAEAATKSGSPSRSASASGMNHSRSSASRFWLNWVPSTASRDFTAVSRSADAPSSSAPERTNIWR